MAKNDIKYYTANYCKTNSNFIIKNINNLSLQEKDTDSSIFSVLLNLLQRGNPIFLSDFLVEELKISDKIDFIRNGKKTLLISKNDQDWHKTIKGSEKGNNPAEEFFYKWIDRYIPEYSFIKQLIIPEVEINFITQQYKDEKFKDRLVDFFIPQANLVIEIDGDIYHDKENDANRDIFLRNNGINTIRINVDKDDLDKKFGEIKNVLDEKDILKHYYNFYINRYNSKDVLNIKLVYIIRLQILFLELLKNNTLSVEDKEWKINFIDINKNEFNFSENIFNLAIEDLFIWLSNLFYIKDGKSISKPLINFIYQDKKQTGYISINFSVLKRYDEDIDQDNEIIYIRNDYFDYYKDDNKLKSYNYFRVNIDDVILYKNIKKDDDLIFFLKNIFNYEKFNNGQFNIIKHVLGNNHTVGLLPTSSGKSLCYQMSCLLQPKINFVICPIKSLIKDQCDELKNEFFIDKVNFINSDLKAEKKDEIMNNFSNLQYLFIVIAPERFQSKEFRDKLKEINSKNNKNNLGYVVIDEIHCLSEWGHDFRGAYLNLASTIKNIFGDSFKFLGLTATASINVKKDIQAELGIKDNDIKMLDNATRENLNFKIFLNNSLSSDNEKNKICFDLITQERVNFSNKGIIFTPYATMHNEIKSYLNSQEKKEKNKLIIDCYSGKIESGEKNDIQDNFKRGNIDLLIATKGFGMGVNIKDIKYTIHYGIPGSIESLYQEAGRAGRDPKNKNCNCYIIFSPEFNVDSEDYKRIFSADVDYDEVSKIQKKYHDDKKRGDISKNLFLQIKSDCPEDELVMETLKYYEELVNDSSYCIKFNKNKTEVENKLNKLKILGFIKDWLVDYKTNSISPVVSKYTTLEDMKDYFIKHIEKYEIVNDEIRKYIEETETIKDIIKKVFQWDRRRFKYARRESLKNLYELCLKFNNKEIDADTFKKKIESYFVFKLEKELVSQIIDRKTFSELELYDVFYKKNNNILKLKTKDDIQSLESSVLQFLESSDDYRLNVISGLVKLLLNDFDSLDGEKRFIKGLNYFRSSKNFIRSVFSFCDYLYKDIDQDKKDKLSNVIIKFLKEEEIDEGFLKYNNLLENKEIFNVFIDYELKKIKKINKTIWN